MLLCFSAARGNKDGKCAHDCGNGRGFGYVVEAGNNQIAVFYREFRLMQSVGSLSCEFFKHFIAEIVCGKYGELPGIVKIPNIVKNEFKKVVGG